MTAAVPLPPGQYRVAAFIARHFAEHGWPPSMREIADELDLVSTNTVTGHLRNLARRGVIRVGRAYASRTVRVVRPFHLEGAPEQTITPPYAGDERAQIVARLRELALDELADSIEAGRHWEAPR